MIDTAILLHYTAVCLAIVLPALGVGLGQGLISMAAFYTIDRQPRSKNKCNRLFFVAVTLTETASVLSVLVGVVILTSPIPNLPGAVAELGAALAIALPAGVVGINSAFAAREAFRSLSRQPFIDNKIMNLMLLTQSIIQTPVIFGLIMGWLLIQQVSGVATISDGLKFFGSGLVLAIGSIGPTIGLANFAKEACKNVGLNREVYAKTISFTFISQAMIETPILFSLVVSLILYFRPVIETGHYVGFIYTCAALAAGVSTFATGLSSGKTAATACREIRKYPEQYQILSRTSLLGQTMVDTNAIYGLIVAILMIFSN